MPPMQYPPAPHDPALAEARALLARKDFNAARVLLKAIVSRNPNSNEAVLLLLRVEEEQAWQRTQASRDADTSSWSRSVKARQANRPLFAVITGVSFFFAGMSSLNEARKVGIHGEFPSRGKTSHVRMVSGKEALATGLIAATVGAGLFAYGARDFRIR